MNAQETLKQIGTLNLMACGSSSGLIVRKASYELDKDDKLL